MNISTKITLTKLKHAIVDSKKNKDEKMIVIPIKANNLFLSEKGNVFLDLILAELSEDKRKYSDFCIFQNLQKEVREKLEQEGKKSEIIGNAKYLKPQESEPNHVKTDDFIEGLNDDSDDLPF